MRLKLDPPEVAATVAIGFILLIVIIGGIRDESNPLGILLGAAVVFIGWLFVLVVSRWIRRSLNPRRKRRNDIFKRRD